MVWQALAASAGLGALGGALNKSAAADEARTLRRRTRQQIEAGQREQAPLFNQREQLTWDRIDQVTTGYNQARQEIDKAAYGSRRAILDREEQSKAQLGQALVGLSGTGVLNAYRGLSEDTSRQMSQVDARLAQLYGSLTERETQAVDQSMAALDRFYQSKQGYLQGNRDLLTQALTGGLSANPQLQSPDFGGLLELFSAFGGAKGSAPTTGASEVPYYLQR